MKKLLAITSGVVLCLCLASLASATIDDFMGVWHMNPSKSKFGPDEARKNEVRMISNNDQGMHVSVKLVMENGTKREFEYTANLDGKDYPIVGVRTIRSQHDRREPDRAQHHPIHAQKRQ